MQTSFEQAVEVVKSLPNEDLARFDDWFEREKRKKNQTGKSNLIQTGTTEEEIKAQIEKDKTRFAQSMNWIAVNKEKYKGQWLALAGDILLAHGSDGKKVHAEARAKGEKNPLLHRIREREELPFGGW